ncbi:MAG: hypothetical protein AAFX76_08990, partial [Planctomycetota bacterium]
MPSASAKQQQHAAELREQLHRNNRLYYLGEPTELSDQEFDQSLRELQDLEAQFPRHVHPRNPHQPLRRRTQQR